LASLTELTQSGIGYVALLCHYRLDKLLLLPFLLYFGLLVLHLEDTLVRKLLLLLLLLLHEQGSLVESSIFELL
jgi:hypothetical protein